MDDIKELVSKYAAICILRCFNPWVLTHGETLDQSKPIEDVYQDDYLGEYGSIQLGDIISEKMTEHEKISFILYFYDIDDLYNGIGTDENDSPALYFLDKVEGEVTNLLSKLDLTTKYYINNI